MSQDGRRTKDDTSRKMTDVTRWELAEDDARGEMPEDEAEIAKDDKQGDDRR